MTSRESAEYTELLSTPENVQCCESDMGSTERLLSCHGDDAAAADAAEPNTADVDLNPAIPSKAEATQEVDVTSGMKLKSLVYLIIVACLALVIAVIEIETNTTVERMETGSTENPARCDKQTVQRDITTELRIANWFCHVVKWFYSVSSMAVIFYLHRFVLAKGTVQKATSFIWRDSERKVRVIIDHFDRYTDLPKHMGSSQPKELIYGYMVFLAGYLTSGFIEIIDGANNNCGSDDDYLRIITQLLCTISAAAQFMFFFVNRKKCILWKLNASWWCLVHLLATNIAGWFFTVALEVQEINSASQKSNRSVAPVPELLKLHGAAAKNSTLFKISRLLYPFSIEYYVLSSFMALTMMTNIGRIWTFLRETFSQEINCQESSLLSTLRSKMHTNHRGHAQSQLACNFLIGLIAVVGSLVLSACMKTMNSSDADILIIDLVFLIYLALLSICGIVCLVLMLCFLNAVSQNHLSSIHGSSKPSHIADRALLWLGAAAIVTNDTYTFIRTCAKTGNNSSKTFGLAYNLLLASSCALNVCQSVLQVFTLECALVKKFRHNRHVSRGRSVINILITVNVSQWIINAVCFNFFFPKGQMEDALILSLLTVPLQVFYRFHSATYMFEFKRHWKPDAEVPAGEESIEPPLPATRVDFSELMGPDSVEQPPGAVN